MLSPDGCRSRRRRFWESLSDSIPIDCVRLADPIHLAYFANCYVEPISLGADYGGVLELHRDGRAVLWHENRLPKSVEAAHVDERKVVPWYDGQTPGQCVRRLAVVNAIGGDRRIHDHPSDPLGPALINGIAQMRRRKDLDEIDLLKRCMRVAEAGFAWSRTNIQPGMTELDAYAGVSAACMRAAGHWAIIYGDFAVSPGPERRGGPPTPRVIQAGDMLILDYSVVLGQYRGDFTNTLVVGREPAPGQKRLYDLCIAAMRAGEQELRAGAACQTVYDAVRASFASAGMADYFPHHAGHGLGLSHPEAPFIVRHSTETLIAGDVVTLEPGLYVEDVGGIRIEHNYLVTDHGYERLSQHEIVLR
jgi:hypothetical protein